MIGSEKKKRSIIVGSLILLLLVVDQIVKILVKTNMALGDSIEITKWFYIHFTENPGMAFGWDFFNKYILTIFRIVASMGLLYLIVRLIKSYDKEKPRYSLGFILTISAIFAGAFGNIIDSVFYGQLFSHSHGQVAQFLPAEGGYAPWLNGKVVDMFYFPIIQTVWPSWVPFFGGEELIFFRPIFNVADACISVGGILLITLYYKSFGRLIESSKKHEDSTEEKV
ncbi:peptidase A8 [Porphyromonas canoris]|uniref:lipoprotein signal peptidase n=1 Tax=Porphyromonas TaxID=836 RepID=UPI00051DEF78|nr:MULTISPECIES: lipoprotein signal peptidase [Porphyromonas]KGL53953.1 peptidase A8 [Porphyromonas canoris]KGN96694.1 peptidase A8 [Porphyromonas sp. COT-108 OH2963]